MEFSILLPKEIEEKTNILHITYSYKSVVILKLPESHLAEILDLLKSSLTT